MTSQDSVAQKFFYKNDATAITNDSEKRYSHRITKAQTSWLFSYNSAKNMNGYTVCAGSFLDSDGITVFWDATKIKHGSAIINYVYPLAKVTLPVKSDTLIILEAVRDAFNMADDELNYSALTSSEKGMLTAQRKAINLEIRMNK